MRSSTATDKCKVMNQRSHRHQWPFLDLVRWSAAFFVLVGHARGFALPNYADVPDHSIIEKALYAVTGLQHEGVVLFFVVSGFLVGGPAWEAIAAGKFGGVRYFANRFTRIYIVFIPGLVLSILIGNIGTTWFADTRAFASIPNQLWSAGAAICHAACLQGVYCSVVTSNPPLWTLSYEWILYMIAPVFFAAAYASASTMLRSVMLLALAVGAAAVIPSHFLWSWVAIWMIGACAYRFMSRGGLPPGAGVAAGAAAALSLALSRTHLVEPIWTDVAIASAFALALSCGQVLMFNPLPRLMDRLGDFSYSLYVTHLPIVVLVAALLERSGFAGPNLSLGWTGVAACAIMTMAAVAFAALFGRMTEAHTGKVRAFLMSDTGRKAARKKLS